MNVSQLTAYQSLVFVALTEIIRSDESALALIEKHSDMIAGRERRRFEPVATARAIQEMEVPVFGAWQPIETAPKDGTPVIISVASFVGQAAYRAEGSHEGAWWWANEGPGDYYADSIDSQHGEPTRWMPLPDPPKEYS